MPGRTPAPPACRGGSAQGGGSSQRPHSLQEAKEVAGLAAPADAHLARQHHEPLRAWPRQLWLPREFATPRDFAPSRSRLPGCGRPPKGDTSVTSQHSASPHRVAEVEPAPIVGWDPWRSGAATAIAEAPRGLQRATRTHAHSRIGACRARCGDRRAHRRWRCSRARRRRHTKQLPREGGGASVGTLRRRERAYPPCGRLFITDLRDTQRGATHRWPAASPRRCTPGSACRAPSWPGHAVARGM